MYKAKYDHFDVEMKKAENKFMFILMLYPCTKSSF